MYLTLSMYQLFTVINGNVIEHHEYDYEDIAIARLKEFDLLK